MPDTESTADDTLLLDVKLLESTCDLDQQQEIDIGNQRILKTQQAPAPPTHTSDS